MAGTARIRTARTSNAALAEDIKALQGSLAELADHFENGTLKSDALRALVLRAEHLGARVAETADGTVKLVTEQIEDHPLLAILIAFGIGLIGERLLFR